MILNNTLKYLSKSSLIIFLLLFSYVDLFSQEINKMGENNNSKKKEEVEYKADIRKVDTTKYKFGVRVGIDLTGPIGSLLNSQKILYKGTADIRIYKKYFAAAEYGYELYKYNTNNLKYESEGFFTTIGGDYDLLGFAYPRNDIYYFGVRYGFAGYRTEVKEYRIENTYWGNDPYVSSVPSQDGYAHWLNLRMGLKVEVLKNFYLGASVGANFLISATEMKHFDNLYIPGFGSNNEGRAFVFNYTLMYMFPFN